MASQTSNLPGEGQSFLDHVGHFVPDPDDAAAALDAAGFTVTPFSAQQAPDPATGRPGLTGTGNVCVMLRGGYLEFLAHTADTPIGREFKQALARRAGLHLAAFALADAESTHAGLAAAGFPMRPVVRMSREVETATGPAQARFTVARLQQGVMPEGRIQFLTHGSEAALWQERWLGHRNGATGLVSMLVSSPDPADAAARFSELLGRSPVPKGSGYCIALDRGAIELLDEQAATALVGTAVQPGASVIVGYRLAVDDLGRAAGCMADAGLAVRMQAEGAVVPFPPALGLGAWLLGASGSVARPDPPSSRP